MGEYLKYKGQDIKIGTCESLYYVTFDQLKAIATKTTEAQPYLDPKNGFHYRFPFPDELTRKPGEANDFDRGELFIVPKSYGIEIAHGTMFHRTDDVKKGHAPAIGYRLPCIQSPDFIAEKFDWQDTKNMTIFEVVRQKQVMTDKGMELQTIVRCPYCGDMCRLSNEEAVAFHKWASETHISPARKQIVEIILSGYQL